MHSKKLKNGFKRVEMTINNQNEVQTPINVQEEINKAVKPLKGQIVELEKKIEFYDELLKVRFNR